MQNNEVKNIHCPMIHGGIHISFRNNSPMVYTQQCCLRPDAYENSFGSELWNDSKLQPLRELNNANTWHEDCWTCQGNELAGLTSFRTGMLEKFGERKNLSGPQRLDLMFDTSCNLACRSCGPQLSTFWQKHLKEHQIKFTSDSPISKADEMIDILKTLDLSNLEMVVFCGGETLMGNAYWQVASAIADMCPQAKDKITLCFQTNGTQPVDKKYYSTIEKFQLIKLHISLDGINEKFEYLRWPATWNQVVGNINNLKETIPVNVMFLIEETMSIFNLYYQHELDSWVKSNFSTNRLNDIVNHTRHVANRIYGLHNLTQTYIDNLTPALKNLIADDWKENPAEIRAMIAEIRKFDQIRNQDFTKTFPEVAEFYSNYL
jgi:sulfatase maturation enzyme AslB (radical SAM superfamily)